VCQHVPASGGDSKFVDHVNIVDPSRAGCRTDKENQGAWGMESIGQIKCEKKETKENKTEKGNLKAESQRYEN
jgi:hypothetical protein